MTVNDTDFSTLPLTRQTIEERLPHSGNMCLLNRIIAANEQSLTAEAISHLDASNPLIVNGRISAINGVEYAAQAMAIHGSLRSGKSHAGYIATVRNIELNQEFLPQKQGVLLIQVEQLMNDDNGFSYQFQIHCQDQLILSGRITVFLVL